MPAINDKITYSVQVTGGTPTFYLWAFPNPSMGQFLDPNTDLPCEICTNLSSVRVKWLQSGVGEYLQVTVQNNCSAITLNKQIEITTGCVAITSIIITG